MSDKNEKLDVILEVLIRDGLISEDRSDPDPVYRVTSSGMLKTAEVLRIWFHSDLLRVGAEVKEIDYPDAFDTYSKDMMNTYTAVEVLVNYYSALAGYDTGV